MSQTTQPGGLRCHDAEACAMGQLPCPTPKACNCAPPATQPAREWLQQSAQDATDRDTHFYLAGWNGAEREVEANAHFNAALQAAPPAPAGVAVPDERAAFEEHFHKQWPGANREQFKRLPNSPDMYESFDYQFLWNGWKARAALAAAPAQAVASSITVDFKQAAELLEMFGGEPAEITLMTGDGHSGIGLYASYTDMPEEGAEFLGTSDDEALPAAPAQEHATQLAGQGQEPAPPAAVAGPIEWPATCDGLEQEAWESWARVQRFDMTEHPMHYLFLHERTDAARQGWKAGLVYAVEQIKQRVHVVAAAPIPVQEDALTKAVRDVLAERLRQVSVEGYDAEHDDAHELGEIGALAALYLMPDGARSWDVSSTGYGDTLSEALLPNGWSLPAMGGDPREDAVKGVAFGLAELERLDRAAARAAQGGL